MWGGSSQPAAEGTEQSGILSSIFSKGAKMASSAVGAPPVANLELTAPPDQRLYFCNGDEISGALSLEVPQEIQHQGIKVILRGIIQNKNKDGIYSGAGYEFIQLTRDLDGPGQL